MENKRIRNATPREYNGIKFKSLSEVMVYKTLTQQGFLPEYERHSYIIWKGFTPSVPYYTKNKFKKKNRNIEILSETTANDNRPLSSWVYTPDIYFEYNGKKIIIEVKGFANDLYSYKCKLFRKYLEEQEDKDTYEFWEIYTKKQLLECINKLKKDGRSLETCS